MGGFLSRGLADYERRRALDAVVGYHEILGRRVDLPVAGVAGEAGVRAARDLEPEPVPAAEPVRRGDQGDPDGPGQRVGLGEADDTIADVARPAVSVDVAQAHEQIGVRVVAGHVQFGGHVADDLDRLGQRLAGEQQNVGTLLDRTIVAYSGVYGQDRAAHRRRGVRRVVAEARGRSVGGFFRAERAVGAEIPPLLRLAGRPGGQVAPFAGAADPDAHRVTGGRLARDLAGVAFQPGEAFGERGPGPRRGVQMSPRADEHAGGHAPLGQRPELL